MFPFSSSISTRTAFARSGPGAFRSPMSSLVCSPPTPRSHRPRLRSPLPLVYLERMRLFFARHTVRTQTVRRLGGWSPAPRIAGSLRGETRLSRVAGSSLSHAPRAKHHAGCASALPYRSTSCCLQGLWNLGHPESIRFSRPPRRGSCACLPTHRRCRRRSPSQGWLPSDPARSFSGGVSHPRDDKLKFWNLVACSSFSDQRCLVAATDPDLHISCIRLVSA